MMRRITDDSSKCDVTHTKVAAAPKRVKPSNPTVHYDTILLYGLIFFVSCLGVMGLGIIAYPTAYISGHITVPVAWVVWTFIGIAGIYFVYVMFYAVNEFACYNTHQYTTL